MAALRGKLACLQTAVSHISRDAFSVHMRDLQQPSIRGEEKDVLMKVLTTVAHHVLKSRPPNRTH